MVHLGSSSNQRASHDLLRSLSELIMGSVCPGSLESLRLYNLLREEDDWKARLSLSEKERVGFAAPGGDFTKAVYKHVLCTKDTTILRKSQCPVVVELGAGMSAYGYMLACHLGAEGYLGIEAFYADCLARSIEGIVQQVEAKGCIPFCIAAEDMLSTLQRLPDACAAIFAFGIEDCILGGESYRKKVEDEIARVISPNGFFLSLRSDLAFKGRLIDSFHVKRHKFSELASLQIRH